MKTRMIMIKNLGLGLVGLFLLLLTVPAYSQCPGGAVTLTIGNFSSTSTTIEYDIFITNNSTQSNVLRLGAYAGNVLYNASMLPSGATGTLTVVDQPSATIFGGVSAAPIAPNHVAATRQLRWTFSPIISNANSTTNIPIGTPVKFCRFRFTSSLPWTASFAGNLRFSTVSTGGVSLNTLTTYCDANTASTGFSLALSNLTLSTGNSQQTPFTFTLNAPSCPTAATASNLVAESPCVGAANGSALITLTGAPSATSAVTYTVDGGATQNATLSDSAFTVSGLSAGSHVVAVTYPSCSAVSTSSFSIGAGTALTTNGSVTTSICAGASYTWPANGQSYTTAQSGTTFVDGCNTATLNLSITPATTTGSVTTSVCDGASYTWPANGQSYTTAQSGVTVVDGCNTATLNLSITPVTTTGSESVTACGSSYTWAVSGQSYNASGSYDFVSGCNTATLILVLNTSAQTFYADTDGDGFGAGTAILSCEGQPANTSVNNTDCAPADPLKWRTANFFVDADGDGYNNGFPSSPVCYGATVPSGFVTVNNGVDCNDESASVNPNASEILGNEIDDNCDGTSDEVTPLSSLITTSCGATLTNLSNIIYARQLQATAQSGAIQGYRFRVTNGASVRTIDRSVNNFQLSQLSGGALYATTYIVEVSVKSNGFFRAYGAPCNVTTPAVPNATFISNPACGSTLANISNTIYCAQAPGASGYRFRVRNGATLVGTVDRTVNRFSLADLGVANIAFGTTYTVDVLLAFGGTLRPESEYGSTCTFTTPATPATSRVIQPSCGSTIINSRWTVIYAQQVSGAQGYKFVVTNGAQTREFATANARFQLQQLAGGAAANTAYTIRVDVLYNSSYVVGTQLCTITTSAGMTRQTDAALAIYEVNAYPNPYAETFKLNVNTSSEDQVGVRVYDMLGREVETRQASVAAITNLEIGSQYPSGVYNIVVTQGNNVKTVRVVKR